MRWRELRELWRQTGQTVAAEQDERAELASLRAERMVSRVTMPVVILALGVLALAPLSDHQRSSAVGPVFVGVIIMLAVVNAVATRRYRPQTALSTQAQAIRSMLAMPVIALPIFLVVYLASGRSHGWLAALAPAVIFLLMTEGLLWLRLRRTRRGDPADGSEDRGAIISGAKKGIDPR